MVKSSQTGRRPNTRNPLVSFLLYSRFVGLSILLHVQIRAWGARSGLERLFLICVIGEFTSDRDLRAGLCNTDP
jgi:hypothetical protein